MKKKYLNKIFSAFAVLSISAGVACALPFAGCSKSLNNSRNDGDNYANVKTVTIDTALGTTQSRTSGRKFYVSSDAMRNDVINSDGSLEKPYHIETVLDIPNDGSAKVDLKPGDTIVLLPGEYKNLENSIHIRPSGAFNSYIEVRPATVADDGISNEQAAVNDGKVVLNFSKMSIADGNRGIQIYGNYIYWHDIDVCGAGDNGIFVAGKYNTIENCDLYNNRDTGLQLGREASIMTHINQWPAYNLIKNISSHNNYDNGATYGENADGFGGKLSIGYGNVFDGCIAYRNSDDGWDLFAYASNGNIGTILIENCIAYENGFLEYTREESNSIFAPEEVEIDEKSNVYDTSNGDGNGFKLGGQIMEGDVVVRNSVAYGNKLHGVTDNSNPGLIRLENVTSFDNNAYISASGLVDRAYSSGGASNIDLARWDYSYNSVINSISSESGRFSVGSDNYRGSVKDSIFKGYKAEGCADLNTREGISGSRFTNPAANEIFEQLPVEGTTYNLSGLGEVGKPAAHTALRNDDGSVNLGNILKVKADADQKLIAGKTLGADLSKSSWDEYEHYYKTDTLAGLDKENETLAKLQVAYNTLEIACNPDAVYHPFDVVNNMHDISVSWSSSDESVAIPGTVVDNSAISGAEFITIDIFRDDKTDKKAVLTATLSLDGQQITKDFEITVKKGNSKIGEVSVVTAAGEILGDGQSTSTIVDRFEVYKEPVVQVRDALHPDNVKYLKPEQYTTDITYYYQTDASMEPVKVKGFTASNAGVFTITVKATLKSDNTTSSMTYKIYVASAFAKADFNGAAKVSVYRDGFIIAGTPGSATGILYAVASEQPLTLSPENIAKADGVQVYPYRATDLNVKFNMANKAGYHIYYAMANSNGEVTSQIYEETIGSVAISTAADFKKMAQGIAINGEVPEKTVYLLTDDIDLSSENGWKAEGSFKGLLNGQGHTVKNLTVSRANNGEASIFYRVEGGTVMNVKFKDISITNTKNNTGLVGQCFGGYFHNLVLENVDVKGVQRSGGLIGMVRESALPLQISQVYADAQSSVTNGGGDPTKTTRAGGLIGALYYEKDSAAGGKFDLRISDCLVSSTIDTNDSDGASGYIGEIDTNGRLNSASECYVEFNNCVFNGVSYGGSHRNGGLVGYFKNSCVVRATGCLFTGEIRYDDTSAGITNGVMITSKKNISGLFGGFVASAAVTVVNCVSLFEEYESTIKEYVAVYSKETIAEESNMILKTLMNFDTETKWSFVYAEGDSGNLKEPFLKLNFLNS